jgi:Asp-tRNA(Asn)/Glu-tRNA(Gln) amidotransferase A subunit family amidase
VAVKDIFNVDGLPTQAGSRLPASVFAGPEAAAVAALRAAGALVLGKSVSTEFAYFAPGPTRNPHNPAHTPGGSSSGSAAAVAVGLAPLALGSQTIGSIFRPAAFCGVVGFKPSYERISRAGVVPLSPSLDHVGLFALDVAGIEPAARTLCHNWHPAAPTRRPVIGIPTGPYLNLPSPAALAHFEGTCQRLAAAGYEVRPVPALAEFEAIRARHHLIVAAEAAQVHARWYADYAHLYHARTAELIERGQAVPPAALAEALAGREALRADLLQRFDTHGVDLLIAPAALGPAPAGLDSTGDPAMNLPWTHAGLPALTLPAGLEAGLPLGLQVVGRWHGDEALLAWASGLELAIAA